MQSMLDLFEISDSLYQQVKKIPTSTILRVAKTGDIVGKVLKFFPD
jgi:hypothetical protein